MSKTAILKPIGASANEIYQQEDLKAIVWNRFTKAAKTGAYRRASHHYIKKKVSKIEIVLSTQTLQSAFEIYFCNCLK